MTQRTRSVQPNLDWMNALSSEELRALLGQDEQDAEVRIAASKLLDARETEPVPDVDAAWETFRRDYLPLAERGEPLYDAEPAPKPARRRLLPRIAGIAAALAVVFFAGCLIPTANGSSVWHTFVLWTRDAFSIDSGSLSRQAEVPEALRPLRQLLSEHGLDLPQLLPQWLPEDYALLDTRCDEREGTTVFLCQLEKEPGDDIILFYRRTDAPDGGSIFEKNETPPEEYVVHGVTHYILQNVDRYTAVWQRDDLECSIQSVADRDDLLCMIDSIYGELP